MAEEETLRKALSQGEADVAYGRVMLVGAARVGKTCFKRGLMGLSFDPYTDSTIVADVQSVKSTSCVGTEESGTVERQWMKPNETERWCEITEKDEIQELAKLIVVVQRKGMNLLLKVQGEQLPNHRSLNRFLPTRDANSLQKLMESRVIQKAFEAAKSIKRKSISHHLSLQCQPLFHLWDCGGQPVFLALLPIFLTSRTIFLLFFNAAKDLKQPWESVFHKGGKDISQGKVNCTTIDMMERWIAMIYSQLYNENEDPGYPRVIPIGTRKDEIVPPHTPQMVKDEIDQSMKGKASRSVLKQSVIISNTSAGKDDEDPGYGRVRSAISKITSKCLIKKTPVAWVLFRKFLQLFHSNSELKQNIISFDLTVAIGSLCKVKKEDIPHVLNFYHDLGVFLYYPNIKGLEHKVILNPQWFVDCLGKILSPHLTDEDEHDELIDEWRLLQFKGILTEKLYTTIWSQCEGVQPEELIELLVHFQLAVKIDSSLELTEHFINQHRKKYFLPAVLPYSPSSVDPHPGTNSPPVTTAAPLHVTFNTGFVVPGFFTRLSTVLLKVKNDSDPKLSLYFKDGVFHDMVKYRFDSLPGTFLTLTEHSKFIEILISCYAPQQSPPMFNTCVTLKQFLKVCCEEVQRCLQSLHPSIQSIGLSLKQRVVCHAMRSSCGDQSVHYLQAHLKQKGEDGTRVYFVCENNEKYIRPADKSELYWYEDFQDLDHLDTSIITNNTIIGDQACCSQMMVPQSLPLDIEGAAISKDTIESSGDAGGKGKRQMNESGYRGNSCITWLVPVVAVITAILVVSIGPLVWGQLNVSRVDSVTSNTQPVNLKPEPILKAEKAYIVDDSEALLILSDIPLTTKLRSFCMHLGLSSAGCSEIVSKSNDYEVQRNDLLQLWGEKKRKTWNDFIIALDRTGYCSITNSLAKEKNIINVLKNCL